ncbi:hypothetical protein TDB9533_03702 [Thalassocella blandensis]|nr:hypothetical protein TDB9533_03702 [Thalassocella blandensis]
MQDALQSCAAKQKNIADLVQKLKFKSTPFLGNIHVSDFNEWSQA